MFPRPSRKHSERLERAFEKAFIRQFLICFQARGAPREGQGDPGARRRPDYPKNPPKPLGNL